MTALRLVPVVLSLALLGGCSSLSRPSLPAQLKAAPPGSCVYFEIMYVDKGLMSYRREEAADIRARCDDERVCTTDTIMGGVTIQGRGPGRTTVRISFHESGKSDREEHSIEVKFNGPNDPPLSERMPETMVGCIYGQSLARHPWDPPEREGGAR